jgi:segregation and condensation protein B
MLYATTRRFLEVFGLAALSDLPTLREIEELLRDRAADEVEPEAAESASGDAPRPALDESPVEDELDPDFDLEPPLRTH